MKSTDYKTDYLKRLKNPKYAKGLLKTAFAECIDDNHWESFGLLLQDIIEANGNKSDFAKKAKISRQHLYRLFSKNANPTLNTLSPVLSGFGLRLTLAD
jgi:DNA-binding phage protein